MAIYTSGFICQQAIEDQEHVFSAIQIIDRIEVDLPTDVDPSKIVISTHVTCAALLLFRSDEPEDFDVTFTAVAPVPPDILNPPPGIRLRPREFKGIHSGGGVHGHQMRLNLRFDPRNRGLWWFEVAVNGRLVLKMPLELVLMPDTSPAIQPTSDSPEQQSQL